jgi:hypothetical protein
MVVPDAVAQVAQVADGVSDGLTAAVGGMRECTGEIRPEVGPLLGDELVPQPEGGLGEDLPVVEH